MKHKKLLKTLMIIAVCMALAVGIYALAVNFYVKATTKQKILTPADASALEDVDCIVVLGCKVKENGVPSHMLEDRILQGVELYKLGASPKIIMSGDHGTQGYDEVNAMKQYAINLGVPSEDIFMDHAGFSTYESMYRAKEIFGAQKIIVVTQEYHLYRALYIADALGLDACGVASNPRSYSGQLRRDVREILARNKDFLTAIFKPEPTYLGEPIPVSGNGNLTND